MLARVLDCNAQAGNGESGGLFQMRAAVRRIT